MLSLKKLNYMKKIALLFTLFITGYFAANAQIQKGAILLGGQLAYSKSTINYNSAQADQKNQNANINISVGKALKDNSVFGVNVGYSPTRSQNSYNGNVFVNSTVNHYSAGLFYRQYKKLAKDFYFYAEAGAGYIGSNQTLLDNTGNNKVKYTQAGGQLYVTPGIAYAIFKKMQLEILIPQIISLQYANYKTKSATENTNQKQFAVNTSLNATPFNSLGVGFRFVL